MNEIKNIKVFIKSDETLEDIIADICDDASILIGYDIKPDDLFVFSAILKDNMLKLNIVIEDNKYAVYSIRYIVNELLSHAYKSVAYVQPPLDIWISLYKPLINTMVTKAHSLYKKSFDRDDLLSILYMTLLKLYNKGYYLHSTFIYKCYRNDINIEYRDLKHKPISLDQIMSDDSETTLLDQIEDITDIELEEQLFKSERALKIKELMLRDIGELQYKRILIQLASHTIDRSTSYILNKYRELLGSDYVPRPNSRYRPNSTRGDSNNDK